MVNSFGQYFLAAGRRLGHGPRFTGQCLLCAAPGQPGLDICTACEHSLPTLGRHCRQCALPLAAGSEALCGRCLQAPPPFTRTVACWPFRPPVAQLIARYKYYRQLAYGRILSEMACRTIASAYLQDPAVDLLCTTPLHWRRRLQRGFNQCTLLAEHFAHTLDIPLFKGLKRIQATPAQQSLNARQRRRNLRRAFQVVQAGALQDKTVAVVDDVMTTGATATEISHTLLEAGAREVHIWVLARTPASR